MGEAILYSNCIGTYLFSPEFKIIDKLLFKNDKTLYEIADKLKKGLWLDSEKELIKKHSKSCNISYFGFKDESLDKINIHYDSKNFNKLSSALKVQGIYSDLREKSILITKNRIRNGLKKDFMIMQAISAIDELDKVSNLLVSRLREWCGVYLPEFSNYMQDNVKFVEMILSTDRKTVLGGMRIKDEDSMGADLGKEDLKPIFELAEKVNDLYTLRKKQESYLESLMKEICPNVTAITGVLIGGKLFSHAGSLQRLSEFPASTIQILGAEKALFRHMKTGSRPPKYGILFQHPFVSAAEKSKRGKVARILGDKISIASKVDYFKGKFIGDKLREDIEKRIK